MIMETHNQVIPNNDLYKEGFNFLFDQVGDYLFLLDEKGTIMRVNNAVLESLEYSRNEMIGMNIEVLLPLTRRTEVQVKVKGMLAGTVVRSQFPLLTKSGRLIAWEIQAFKGQWEDKDVFYGIGRDAFDERVEPLTLGASERNLEKGDQKLKYIQAILDSLPFIAWMKDKQNRYILVNRAFENFYKLKNSEVTGKTDFDIFPRPIALQYAEISVQSLNKLLLPFQHQMGSHWLEIFISPFQENGAETAGTLGIARNITERKQLELELANQKRFLKTMLDTIPDYIFYKDINSAYLGCNKAYAEKYLGVNEAEVRGKTDLDVIRDVELANFYRQKDRETFRFVKTRKYEGRYVLTDGRAIDTETVKTPFMDEQGNLAGLIGVARDITNRKSLERQLRKQAEYAELLFKTVPNAVLSTDKHGKIIRWNKIAEEITGYAVAEVIGKECSQVLHGVNRNDCLMCHRVTDAPLINKKCKIITKDGRVKHVLKSIAVLKDEFGEINEKMECFEDITEMIDLEEELRESRERYAAIVNNAPQIVVIHKKGLVEFVNDAGMEVLGYTGDEFVNSHMKGFKTEDLFGGVNSILIEQIKGEGCLSCEIELIKKSGEVISVLLKGTGITYERERAILAVMMDITESKQLNAKLRASEEKFRQLAETINEIFLITDMEEIVYVSPAYERISGMSCQSLLDNRRSLIELIHPNDRERMQRSFFRGFQEMNNATNEEFRIIRPDGETRWLWLQGYPVRDEANNSTLKAISIVDITDRKKIEDKLWERERQTRIELMLAARVQKDSLPHSFWGDKVRVSAIFEPYSTVSGDFFNYKWLEEQNKLCGYIVDVSGHGVATALQTATFKMMLDNVLLTGETIEVSALQIINQRIMHYLYEDSFVALLYFEFDLLAAKLTLISAGITLFLAAKPQECTLVPISGCYLGIIDEPEIEKKIIPLKAGEIYCMMSDGASDLIELCGIRKQEGFSEYENWLKQLAESPERNDDFSVICVEILPGNKESDELEIKTEEDLIRAHIIISDFLDRNASSYAPVLEVAVNEALNNGFDYGGRVRVKLKRVGGKLIVRIKDHGPGFNTKRIQAQITEDMYEKTFEQMLESEGGRGILLMKLFCDKVIYNAKGNEVLLMKEL